MVGWMQTLLQKHNCGDVMMTENMFKRKLKKLKKRGERYKKEKEIRDAYAEYVPEKVKRKTSNILLAIAVIANISYVVAAIWLQLQTGVEISSTLTTCWFTFWGCEIFVLAGIKVSKVLTERNSGPYEIEDTSEI